MIEHLNSEISHRTLRYVDHQPALYIGSEYTDTVKYRDPQDRLKKRGEVPAAALHHRRYVAVDQRLRKQGTLYIGQHADDDQYDYKYEVYSVAPEHIAHEALKDLAAIFHMHSHAPGRSLHRSFAVLHQVSVDHTRIFFLFRHNQCPPFRES